MFLVSCEDNPKYINILLLGETGVGKSTFINSFANYIQFDTLQTALDKELVCLIPTKFTIPDENYIEQYIEIGNDNNENQDIGSSSTQCTKSYVFPMEGEDRKIRLIDTPGIGDSRGIEQDNKNFENVLEYLSQYEYLHAICFLLKPNVSIITAYFKFCLMHLLSRLEKSAVKNIIFIFTNTRSTLYRPGETLTVLRKILKEVESVPPHISIPCNVQNIFCMDNEAFRFLVALKHDFEFTDDESENFSASWEISVTTSKKVLDYVAGNDPSTSIKPHVIRNTISVNEARRIITDLSKPLVDISDMIQDNLTVLERHENDVSKGNQSIEEFEDNLFVPCVQIHQIELSQPATVCTADKCSERVVVAGTTKYHYKQKCHQPCFLPNVPPEHIGATELLKCFAMRNGPTCTECGCDFSTHMHILYETKTVGGREENEAIKNKITCTQEQIEATNKLIATLTKRKEEYEHESDIISKTLAKFAHFIKEHSITVFNDAYEDYLDYLISRETNLAEHADSDFIKKHQNLKKQYQQEKQLLELVLTQPKNTYTQITTDDIYNSIKQLYNLKHTGSKIKELHQLQEKMRKKEHSYNTEYYHPTAISKTIGQGKKKKGNSKAVNAEMENLRQQIETMPLDDNESNDNFKDAVLQMLSKFGKSDI